MKLSDAEYILTTVRSLLLKARHEGNLSNLTFERSNWIRSVEEIQKEENELTKYILNLVENKLDLANYTGFSEYSPFGYVPSKKVNKYTESKTDVAGAFAFQILNEQGMIKSVKISNYFQDLLNALNYSVDLKDGRLKSIVITKLEEACFFAKKAMASDPANQA